MKKIYQNFRQISLVIGLTLFASNTQALDCTPTPDCGSLGYTKTEADCQGADVVLKCPTNLRQMACFSGEGTSEESLCVAPKIGDILYSDGSCGQLETQTARIPIGIIFDDSARLAMSFEEVFGILYIPSLPDGVSYTQWEEEGKTCAASFVSKLGSTSCSYSPPGKLNINEVLSCETDGQSNTKKLLNILDTYSQCNEWGIYLIKDSLNPLFIANSYAPSTCQKTFCQKGKWFLPSVKDAYNILRFSDTLQETMDTLKNGGWTTRSGSVKDYFIVTSSYYNDANSIQNGKLGVLLTLKLRVGDFSFSIAMSNSGVIPVVKF